jgi:hypothetical protein
MDSEAPPKKRLTLKGILLAGKRLLKYAFLATLIYLAILLVGLIPVNRDFVEPETGVTIYIVSNAIHADLILPKTKLLPPHVWETCQMRLMLRLAGETKGSFWKRRHGKI